MWEYEEPHSGEKPHQCTQCVNSFSRASTLKTHTMVHSGKKPHQCTQCVKSFSIATNLNTHMMVHSGKKQAQYITLMIMLKWFISLSEKPHKK